MSDSVRLYRRQPTRLPHPWDSPGKNTGVGCHFLLQCMKVKSESEVTQACRTLSNPMDCSPPGPSIHGIFQARVLEWGAIAFSGQLAYSQIKEPFVTYQNHRLSDEISIWEKIETAFGATFHFKCDVTNCTLYLASRDYFPYCNFLSSICFSIFMLEK